mgnify:CR=1 FL=1
MLFRSQPFTIKPFQITSYDYFKKTSEDDGFASGYHRDFMDRLAKNYSYTLSWKTDTGAIESMIISLNDANLNKTFYPAMRRVTGLEMGITR